MGCLLGVLAFILKCVKIAVKAVLRIAKLVIKLIFKVGLGLPLIATAGFVTAWLLGYITQGTWQFDACCVGIAVLTVVCVVYKLTRKDKADKQKQK